MNFRTLLDTLTSREENLCFMLKCYLGIGAYVSHTKTHMYRIHNYISKLLEDVIMANSG